VTDRRARTTATHLLRHSFQAMKETPSNILRTCKPWHIYLLACCLCLSVLKYGRDGTRVLLLAARTGCVERGWMDEREALLRLPHVMMLLSLVFRLSNHTVAMPPSTPLCLHMHA